MTGVDDDIDRDDSAAVTLEATPGSDPNYAGRSRNVDVTCTNDDFAGITINPTAVTVAENGGTDTFRVTLDTEPEGVVTLNVSCGDTAEATIDETGLIFNQANWETGEVVTVTGVNDGSVGGDYTSVTISVNPALSDDVYDPVANGNVSVTCIDDDL